MSTLQDNEIKALIELLDDNDPEVFDHVTNKLLELGPAVIEKLEDAYTYASGPVMVERIEDIIHKIQFDLVEKDLEYWAAHGSDDLLKGILIVTRHQYPDLDEEDIIKIITRIRKDIWIGLNNYLTPLEQINVFNQVIFSQYQFLGLQNNDDELRYSYFNNLLDSNKGNHFTIGLLYLILCQQLELSVYGVRLHTHFILARTKDFITDFTDNEELRADILFYINPYNKGLVFSDREIDLYIRKLDIEPRPEFYLPSSNKAVVKEYIQYLSKLYSKPEDQYKVDDLGRLDALLEE